MTIPSAHSLIQDTYINCARRPTSSPSIERFRRRNLLRVLGRSLDRVNVLGDNATGHTG